MRFQAGVAHLGKAETLGLRDLSGCPLSNSMRRLGNLTRALRPTGLLRSPFLCLPVAVLTLEKCTA